MTAQQVRTFFAPKGFTVNIMWTIFSPRMHVILTLKKNVHRKGILNWKIWKCTKYVSLFFSVGRSTGCVRKAVLYIMAPVTRSSTLPWQPAWNGESDGRDAWMFRKEVWALPWITGGGWRGDRCDEIMFCYVQSGSTMQGKENKERLKAESQREGCRLWGWGLG